MVIRLWLAEGCGSVHESPRRASKDHGVPSGAVADLMVVLKLAAISFDRSKIGSAGAATFDRYTAFGILAMLVAVARGSAPARTRVQHAGA